MVKKCVIFSSYGGALVRLPEEGSAREIAEG